MAVSHRFILFVMTDMYVLDLDGKAVKVTDLAGAIEQAGQFKGYKHEDPAFAGLDQRLNAYWHDLYEKLLQLQMTLSGTSTAHEK